MKIAFPALFQAPLERYTSYLIYGNDPSVMERALTFIQKRLALPQKVRTEAELLKAPLEAPSLFEDTPQRQLILVPHVTDKLLQHIEGLSQDVFVFMSEKARSQSKLVTYFGQAPHMLAISAYATPLLAPEFKALTEDLPFSAAFKQEMFKAYHQDYGALLNAIELLKLLGEGEEEVARGLLTASSLSQETHSLLEAVLCRDPQKLAVLLPGIPSGDFILVLRLFMRSFLTLLEIIPYKGNPQAIQWRALSSPIFFKDQPFFERALSRWPTKDILAFMDHLLALERRVKFTQLPPSHFSRDLLSQMGS